MQLQRAQDFGGMGFIPADIARYPLTGDIFKGVAAFTCKLLLLFFHAGIAACAQYRAGILAQLAGGDSYGYVISKNVQEITRGELQLKEATLYTTFRRLETAGMIESYWGNENAGARRRYYHLTEKGRALFAENQADWRKYRAVISELFGMEDASK